MWLRLAVALLYRKQMYIAFPKSFFLNRCVYKHLCYKLALKFHQEYSQFSFCKLHFSVSKIFLLTFEGTRQGWVATRRPDHLRLERPCTWHGWSHFFINSQINYLVDELKSIAFWFYFIHLACSTFYYNQSDLPETTLFFILLTMNKDDF